MDSSDEEVSRDPPRSTSYNSTEDVQSINVSSREQSVSNSESRDHGRSHVGSSMEEHRNMMLASLLEDYYRNRAVEFLNTTHASDGEIFTRHSPEVQSLTQRLFAQASRTLSSTGLVSSVATSDISQNTRRQYLSGLDSLIGASQTTSANVLDPIHDLVIQSSQLSLLPNPANDLQLTLRLPPPRPSHYQSSFREISLLGKGGFGKVYQCYNVLDQKTYAVKKIFLSPKLGKNFSDGKHDELEHILREVKALAMLDHPNIVRYHATWFEEPQIVSNVTDQRGQNIRINSRPRQQLLLDSQPFHQVSEESLLANSRLEFEQSMSYGIVFGEDTKSASNIEADDANQEAIPSGRGWSENSITTSYSEDESSLSGSNPFTDGRSTHLERSGSQGQRRVVPNESVPVLYIQMSMYPTTLAQYISPSSPSRQGAATADTRTSKHCFHLVPSLRLINSIHAGLQYIHAQGLIHRDIKPGNIFLSAPSLEATDQGGYCDLSCRTCSLLEKQDQDHGDADASSTQPATLPPRWLNPRIGDFGLVAQLAHGKVPSSTSASASAESSSAAASASASTTHNNNSNQEAPARTGNARVEAAKTPSTRDKPVGTAFYHPPPHPHNNSSSSSSSSSSSKIDIFALGVVLVELLVRVGTAMERADLLRGCQGAAPAEAVAASLAREGYGDEVVGEVLGLVRGMLEPDPRKRWEGSRVREVVGALLGRCQKGAGGGGGGMNE
ncbi:kinase-like domain-containing protein [Biscogniauxia mediterranea]|nr:kinase-like domain-containing protein [Biscogniauxia mediterranea]